jgi:hypothetical protein
VNGDNWHLELEKVVSRWSGGDYVYGAFSDEDRPPQHIAALGPGTLLRVGRSADCEIRVRSLAVERQHCAVWRDESGVWVRDLQSRSGTSVRGRPLPGDGPARLELDDVVQVADFAMVLTARFPVSLSWRGFQGGLIAHLARGIAAKRRVEDLPILADALEDAGCELAELLRHLREAHQRERRCWVVKRLLRGLAAAEREAILPAPGR